MAELPAPAEGGRGITLATGGQPPPKSHFAVALTVPPFAAYPLRPGVTFTHFGVAVDDHLRIVKTDGRPGRNVFAAGMIMAANALGEGSSASLGLAAWTRCGRLAAEEAARQARGAVSRGLGTGAAD